MFHQRSMANMPIYREKVDNSSVRGRSFDNMLSQSVDAQETYKNIQKSRNRFDVNGRPPYKAASQSQGPPPPKPIRNDLIHIKSTEASQGQQDTPQRLSYNCRCIIGDKYEGLCRHAFDCLNDPRDRQYIHDPKQFRMFRRLVQKLYLSNCAGCGRQVLRYRSHHTMVPRTRQKLLVMQEAWREKEKFFHMLRWIIRQGYYWPYIEDQISYFRCNNIRPVSTPPVKFRIGQQRQDPMRKRNAQNYNQRNHNNWQNHRKQEYQKHFARIRQQYDQGRSREDSSDYY